MTKTKFRTKCNLLILFAATTTFSFLLTSCKKQDEPDIIGGGNKQRYVLMTMSEITSAKPGFITSFDSPPTGTVSNIKPPFTLNGQGMGGFRTYKNWIFKMFNSSNEKGIVKLKVAETGEVTEDAFIKTNNTINGSGNFVIQDDTHGYYWDGDKPWEIQTFNPLTMAATGKVNFNFESALKKTDAGIAFQGIGQHFLVIKEGKLYADITYSKGSGATSGMFNDFFEDVYIAVINLTTGQYESTTKIPDTGGITYINENEMFSHDSNGDLYIVTQGRSAVGGKSKIARIKAGQHAIDPNWELAFDSIKPGGGKFVGIHAHGGKLITTINNTALTGGAAGNINSGEIWEFFVIDAANKGMSKITGIPASTNAGAAKAAFSLEDKILLRVNAPSANANGFYTFDMTTAKPFFNVTEGGAVTSLAKIEI